MCNKYMHCEVDALCEGLAALTVNVYRVRTSLEKIRRARFYKRGKPSITCFLNHDLNIDSAFCRV
jgi:hypothetical protein